MSARRTTQNDRFDIEVELPDPLPESAEKATVEGFDVTAELESVLNLAGHWNQVCPVRRIDIRTK